MKRLLACTLAAALTLTAGTNAFAADAGSKSDVKSGTEITVNGIYKETAEAEEVISVDVKWDAMKFVYALRSDGDWNPKTHAVEGASEDPGWLNQTRTIEVVNHSNVGVTASMSFKKNDAVTGTLTGSFTETNGDANDGVLTLANAAEGESLGNYDKAPKDSAEFGISGDAIAKDQTLGTITVSIAKNVSDAEIVESIEPTSTEGYSYDVSKGTDPDWSNLVLKVTYKDGHSTTVSGTDAGVTLTPESTAISPSVTTYQTYSYTASYEGKTCTFKIWVEDKSLGYLPTGAYTNLN